MGVRSILTFFPSPYIKGNLRSSSSMVLYALKPDKVGGLVKNFLFYTRLIEKKRSLYFVLYSHKI